MKNNSQFTWTLIGSTVLIAAGAVYLAWPHTATAPHAPAVSFVGPLPLSTDTTDETLARTVVEQFGLKLKEVPLSASSTLVQQQLDQAYTNLVSPDTLARWKQHPELAPGRLTSSPWPERIEISSVQKIDENNFNVRGNIIYLTSNEVAYGGEAGRDPIVLKVGRTTKTGWLSISSVEITSSNSLETAPTTTPTTTTTTAIASSTVEKTAVETVVEQFGNKLKNVPLSTTTSTVKKQLELSYANLVTPELLALWEKNTNHAPGSLTSSPWPERIEIASVAKQSEGLYEVMAYIINKTSDNLINGGETSRNPIVLSVKNSTHGWLIGAMESEMTGNPRPTTTFRAPDSNFEISYPTTGIAENILADSFFLQGTTVRSFEINKNIFNKDGRNNFSYGILTITVSSSPEMIASCSSFADSKDRLFIGTKPYTQVINNLTFSVATTSDDGVGNYYDSQIYRTLHNKTCYEFAMTIHTTNASASEPPAQEFDINKAFTYFKKVLATFHFLN